MTTEENIALCKEQPSYTTQTVCLDNLKYSTLIEGVMVVGGAVLVSIVLVATLMFIHNHIKTRGIK